MASLPVMYALCLVVMTPCLSEAKHEDSNIFTFVPRWQFTYYNPPRNSTKHVKEGCNITLVCSVNWGTDRYVKWYRVNNTNYVAAVTQYGALGTCTGNVKDKTLKKLRAGNTSCIDESHELQIRDIDQDYEGGWYCAVNNKWISGYIDLKVDTHDETSTSRRTTSTTTSIVKETVSKHGTMSSKPTEGTTEDTTEGTTEDTTERTDKESTSSNTLVPLIGGATGGVIVLLVLVITGWVLYRSKRRLSHPDDGKESSCSNRQLGNVDAVVLEGNPLFSSSPGSDDYAEIDCRGPAASSHEKGEASVLKNQNNHDDRNQPGQDSGDIYAIPDKPKKSAAEDIGEASVMKTQPNLGDRNQSQPGKDSGDIYAVPDKPKKSAAEDMEDVYSQVQKPKK